MQTQNASSSRSSYHARGLIMESCSCQLVCPGHIHFDQLCTHERCLGYWALRFDAGDLLGVPIADCRAVLVFDAPRHMIDGDWTETIIIDPSASNEQREALEAVLTGTAGGPWAVLAGFVGRRLETRYLPIAMSCDGRAGSIRIEGLLDASLETIRGRDRNEPVRFENIFNQIHAPSQVIARGTTRYDDGTIAINSDGSHGLWSEFDWQVSAEAESA